MTVFSFYISVCLKEFKAHTQTGFIEVKTVKHVLICNSKLFFQACVRHISVSPAIDVNITSPGYPSSYPRNIVCIWLVSSSSRDDLSVTYLDFRLQDTIFCSSDYVIFSFKPYFQPECSKKLVPVTVETNSNNFTLKFVADNEIESAGFFLQISTTGGKLLFIVFLYYS